MKFDVWGPYNLPRGKEWDEHTLACWMRYDLFEPTVMQFGTSHGPANFQGYINNTRGEAFDDFASSFFG